MNTEGDGRKHQKIHRIILDYRKIRLIEIADTLQISNKCVEHIVNITQN